MPRILTHQIVVCVEIVKHNTKATLTILSSGSAQELIQLLTFEARYGLIFESAYKMKIYIKRKCAKGSVAYMAFSNSAWTSVCCNLSVTFDFEGQII